MKLIDTLKYHGKVTVKTETKSGKIISANTYKNAGTKYLAKFLCSCIAGNYADIDSKRPFKIGLFFNSAESPNEASTGGLTSLTPIYISINKVADVSSVLDNVQNTEIANYKVILHFLIPYSYISIPAGSTANGINQICLYGKDTTQEDSKEANYKDYSASFLLSRKRTDGTIEWDTISLEDKGNNSYNLIIDWEMTFEVEK